MADHPVDSTTSGDLPLLVLDHEPRDLFDLVVARGELDIATHQQLRELLDDAGLDRALLVVDLTRVTFMDSLGLAALVVAARSAMARGASLSLLAVPGVVTRMLVLAGLDRLLDVYPDVQAFTRAQLS